MGVFLLGISYGNYIEISTVPWEMNGYLQCVVYILEELVQLFCADKNIEDHYYCSCIILTMHFLCFKFGRSAHWLFCEPCCLNRSAFVSYIMDWHLCTMNVEHMFCFWHLSLIFCVCLKLKMYFLLLLLQLKYKTMGDLSDFLCEAQVQKYYQKFVSHLKVTNISQLRDVSDEDFLSIGMSHVEIDRMKLHLRKKLPATGAFGQLKKVPSISLCGFL